MRRLSVAIAAAALAGCTYYVPESRSYVAGPPPVATFDRSWAAAVGAFGDQGVRITAEDRGTGTLRGSRDGIEVTASVHSQADGSVRVEFNTRGATARDPGLIERVSRSYDVRMGR